MSWLTRFRCQPLWIKVIVMIYSVCFLFGARNHIMDILRGGLFPYSQWWGVPAVLNAYWTSLTLFDSLAVVLLFTRLRIGLVVSVLIMVTDIFINLYATYSYWGMDVYTNRMLQLQLLFGLFVFVTAPLVWRGRKI